MSGWGRGLHHGAGVAARLAAVPDQEGSVPLAAQQALGLQPVHVPQTPQPLVVVRKVLLILHRAVLTADSDINISVATGNNQSG